ncbi:DUF503 domain-containing protein [Gracilibacillus marinus]|jgi:uncharacterized protein|uniref:DUF503 domain-containing protein n=1 Tax=Gracilibacillus marinus TaxID=630535 RepID=A0ABV8VSL4_9BACI
MILYAEIELRIHDCFSLKDKRSVLLKLKRRIQKELNIAIAELEYQNKWQLTCLGIVTISDNKQLNEKVIQQALSIIDSFVEVERTITHIEER